MVTEISNSKLANVLKNIKSKDGKNNLFEHFNKMYQIKILMNNDQQFNDLFEDISLRIKKFGDYPEKCTIKNQSIQINQKEKDLLKPLVKVEPEGEPQPITQINFVPDYLTIFQRLSWGGISLGDKESLLINNSLRNLSNLLGNGNVSFFGKIKGTEKDYYIAEATEIDPPAEFNYEPDMEKRKEDGINRNVYYATNDLGEKWIELPDIKPSQLIESRKIRYIFTGDLNRQIYSNPTFNGQEKHYLRCQIARIYHGAKLVPSINHYIIEDPENPYKMFTPQTEKPKMFTNEDICNMQYWIHYPPGILKCGRVSHIIDDPPEGVEPDDYKKQIIDKDPFDKRIKSIKEDTYINSGFKTDYKSFLPWKLEQYYEDNIYINPYIKLLDETQPDYDPAEQKDNKANYTVTIVRSLRWPGAINAYVGKQSYFFYFGDGLKHMDTKVDEQFNYKNFPTILNEVDDKEDQPEPHEPVIANTEEKKVEEQK